MFIYVWKHFLVLALALGATQALVAQPCLAQDDSGLVSTIQQVKPSIVAVGSYYLKDVPKARFFGTGFAVGHGRHVITNYHVLEKIAEEKRDRYLRIFHRQLDSLGVAAEIVVQDEKHDLAVLKLSHGRLPPLGLGDSSRVREGQDIAFTGYPIGFVLGLNPTTHTGIISAIAPIILPSPTAKAIQGKHVAYLRDPFEIFQIDAEAFPGNSGSPLYLTRSGEVVGVVNMVFVHDKKENLLKEPTGITYAIPINHARALLAEALSQ